MDENKIELTLTPTQTQNKDLLAVENPAEVVDAAEVKLSDEEMKQVAAFAEQIDISNPQMILQYGTGAQEKIADFSDSALENIRTKDLNEVGDMLTELIGQLKNFDVDADAKGLKALFKRTRNKVEQMKNQYNKVEVNVDKISGVLEEHQIQLLRDISMLEKLYDANLTNYKELSMYILAGKQKLKQAREVDLAAMIERANASSLPEDAQTANDFASLCDRFEKRIHDLELTRTVSLQMAPQIRLVQNNNTIMSEKIQSTLVNTIPLWKSQMVIALGLAHTQNALEAEREVNNMTNALLKKNADMLKVGTIETAKEAERGIVDIETLQHTNESLITILDEVIKIQDEGRTKRRDAEKELVKLESELRNKLLEIHQ